MYLQTKRIITSTLRLDMVQLLLLSDQVGRMDYISVNIEKGKVPYSFRSHLGFNGMLFKKNENLFLTKRRKA